MSEPASLPPGLLISAPSSGAGKTTLTLGLLRALREDGLAVQPFKSGPDYIDPAFHGAAAGRASCNLDTWAMDDVLLDFLIGRARGADLIVAEGSMGLYDGVASAGASGNGASATIALRMGWPVVLVLDVSGQAQSAAATALGFARYHPELLFAGVVLNRVASPRHERLTRIGLEAVGIETFGALPRRPDLVLPERHLGLVQASEHPSLEPAMAACAAFVREHVDVEAIRAAAAASRSGVDGRTSSNGSANDEAGVSSTPPPGQRIALAQDEAFAFAYPHVVEAWRAAGAELLPFSPLADEAPSEAADVVWLPGGYPELHAGRLAAASRFREALVRFADTRPVHGECGGYMALGEGLVDKDGKRHRMAGLLGLETSYEKRKLHLGYRRAELLEPMPGQTAGAALRGHEFHYSTILAQPDMPLAHVTDADGNSVAESGSVRGHVSGSFFHLISDAR